MAKKTKKMPTSMAPGTAKGNQYLDEMDKVRRRRGFKGRTQKGLRSTGRSYDSGLGKGMRKSNKGN